MFRFGKLGFKRLLAQKSLKALLEEKGRNRLHIELQSDEDFHFHFRKHGEVYDTLALLPIDDLNDFVVARALVLVQLHREQEAHHAQLDQRRCLLVRDSQHSKELIRDVDC